MTVDVRHAGQREARVAKDVTRSAAGRRGGLDCADEAVVVDGDVSPATTNRRGDGDVRNGGRPRARTVARHGADAPAASHRRRAAMVPHEMTKRLDRSVLDRLVADSIAVTRRHTVNRPDGFDGFNHHRPAARAQRARAARRARVNFIELGCGSGLITILADLLGYDACGIEAAGRNSSTPRRSSPKRHHASPRFVLGSFLPSDADLGELLDADFHLTDDSTPSAWTELRLADFDLVYAFPWPGEEETCSTT